MPDTLDLPTIDLEVYMKKNESPEMAARAQEECKKVADSLFNYGILIVKDPRASQADNDTFLDMLERYFGQPDEVKQEDVRREFHFQVGVTPEFVELPRDHCERMKTYKDADKPISLCPPEKDAKARFFWRLGKMPTETKFPQLNAAPVVPKDIPEWSDVMNTWGGKLLAAVEEVAEMAAVGFDLPADSFRSRMNYAPHLLAPTASNFYKFGKKDTVLAGYHYDLNALTIHGRSRFPGLFVWTRSGEKKAVKIPAGCLLVQAGKQMEYVTGGHVLAGFHEVVVTDETLAAIENAKNAGKSLWRISSTCFAHFESDCVLEPIGRFGEDPAVKAAYPPIFTGHQVAQELAAINLKQIKDDSDVIAGY